MMPGPKVLIVGEPGTGKTMALRTLVPAGIEPCVIFTEDSVSTISDLKEFRWHFVRPRTIEWSTMADYADKILNLSLEFLSKLPDVNRRDYSQFRELLETLANFKDDRTGEVLGPVDKWGPKRCLILDTLTGVNKMCLDMVTGGRVVRSLPEWGVAIDQEDRLLDALVNLPCTVIVNAHLEPEMNAVTGEVRNYPSSIGKKLAPTLGRKFSEVVEAVRVGDKFHWSTASDRTGTKGRLLPLKSDLRPDYGQLIEAWKARGGELVATL